MVIPESSWSILIVYVFAMFWCVHIRVLWSGWVNPRVSETLGFSGFGRYDPNGVKKVGT